MQRNPSDTTGHILSRIRRSITPGPLIPITEKERRRYFIQHFLFHFRPALVPENTLRLSLSWGLGGMAALLIFLQMGSGVLLKFVYEPTTSAAYASVQSLASDVPFGRLVRNLHHWCAYLLVLMVFLHMLRVFFTGAFHPPRQFNWIIGLALLFTVLIANFTGYLLPWDQLAYWAVTVSTGMLEYVPLMGPPLQEMIRGGVDIGPATLGLFFAIHTAVVPFFLFFLMGFHFWRVRKAGGLVSPPPSEETQTEQSTRVPSLPNLLLREVVMASMLVAVVLWLSIFIDAPLSEPANPGLSPNPTQAPWYFAGLQELLLHLHPVFAVSIIPLMIGVFLISIPYLKYNDDRGGVWFVSQTGRRMGIVAAVISLICTPLLLLADEWWMAAEVRSSALDSIISNGLVPVALLLSFIGSFFWIMKRRFSASANESVQTLFILLTVAFVVLTFTGSCLRGPGMELMVSW